ncbi:hypothetical protein EYB26_006888 [Talaromyces marneffei]|uniref:uncharacterized protein n=1 Tax=Talaromyces marneffei TaxID=37727 RepID=UPI0012A8F7BE|nr:uncharacterized protein EYB26_006888 [Talaromyces marneffei]QGA19200.1 hypothetical protein EYB26_006888 [Talaromyces marneffei]
MVGVGLTSSPPTHARTQNRLAQTPQMGWNTYNHYGCSPNEAIVHSNSQALVDLGLASLGYRYVTTDCGWTVADRLPNGSLTWDSTRFPSGFPALGQYLHGLGLLFGVYQDAGILLCGSPPNQIGSLYHELQDAQTFASWGVDSLKYDNCYSDAATNYPNVNYAPSTSPEPRYANMSNALSQQDRAILFQVCEWGVDFPAAWAPSLGNSWRIGNDISSSWTSIYRLVNQIAPQTDFAGPGQWPDLDMLEVGNNVYSTAEEQTHFSLWAILKSPLVIGAALKDAATSINEESLAILKQKDVISYNQDELSVSANLSRRYTEDEYDVWSGPLSGKRIVAALVNWADEKRYLTIALPDIGIQYAGMVKDIWKNVTIQDVKTSYTAEVEAHGTMLLELQNTTSLGEYSTNIFGTSTGNSTTFEAIYGLTDSSNYTLSITFISTNSASEVMTVKSSASSQTSTVTVAPNTASVSLPITLNAGTTNSLTIHHQLSIESISITPPEGTYYSNTKFTTTGYATSTACGIGYCAPVGSKIGYIRPGGTAVTAISATSAGTKFVEIDYINNEISFWSGWNARNITVTINGGTPTRLEVPMSGRHSELFGPGRGWWDTATLGVLTNGWVQGENEVVIGNDGGAGYSLYAADFVGLRVY